MSIQEIPRNRAIQLRNETCPYCGQPLTTANRTKEHVIGRSFVPVGSLAGDWNLILWACQPCNNLKSKLEDDISAITMVPTVLANPQAFSPGAVDRAKRKWAGSISAKTGKPISDSIERMSFSASPFAGVTFNFEFVAPPQAEEQRTANLAMMQARALFYWLTFDRVANRGKFWRGGFYCISEANKADWGNERLRVFAGIVQDWEPRLLGASAQGMFGIAIRKHPNRDCWSWAFEWNDQRRIVGFFGDPETIEILTAGIPKLNAQAVHQEGQDYIAMRIETPLPSEDDRLFVWDSGTPTG